MGFFEAAHGLGGGEGKQGYTSHKEDPKNIWTTWHSFWVLLTSAFFHGKSANFAISQSTDIDCILIHNSYLF